MGTKTLERNVNRGGALMGAFPDGDAPPLGEDPDIPVDAIWVATTGNDTTGDGTEGNPYLTIQRGISDLTSGKTVAVKDGTYSGSANFINQNYVTIPNGSAGNYTTIRAENPWAVTIESTTSLGYQDEHVRSTGSYIEIFGFNSNMEGTLYPPFQVNVAGDHIKFRKSVIRRDGDIDIYASWVYLGGFYNLVEDVAGCGATRYGFGGGDPEDEHRYNIYRRVVGRFDYSNSHQPKGTFNFYGSNSGYANGQYAFQNCISINGNEVGYNGGLYGYKYGGIQIIKEGEECQVVGCIVLDEELEYGGYWFDGRNHTVRDNVSWDIKRMPTYGTGDPDGVFDRNTMETLTVNEHWTIGDNTGVDIAGDSGNFNPTDSDLSPVSRDYITRPNDGDTDGATILKKIGVSGTLWGETGWDTVTTDDLWPWPNEDNIKTIFSLTNTPPVGNTPTTNDEDRGFCSTVNDAYGKAPTLTRYIWQYLGNQIPAEIYGD